VRCAVNENSLVEERIFYLLVLSREFSGMIH